MGKLSFIAWGIFAAVMALLAYYCLRFKRQKIYLSGNWADVVIQNQEDFQTTENQRTGYHSSEDNQVNSRLNQSHYPDNPPPESQLPVPPPPPYPDLPPDYFSVVCVEEPPSYSK